MSTRQRRGQIAALQRDLSNRDVSILADLARLRLLQARHIQRLWFADGSSLSAARRSRRVLNRLHGLKLVVRMERRVGGVHAGSSGFIYALSSLGQRLLDVGGPAGGSRRRRPWEPSPMFQDHILAVAELYVCLVEADRTDADLDLLAFDAEPACWRHFSSHLNEGDILKPDAYVRAGGSQFEQVSFVEIDLGTEHGPALKRKLDVYHRAFTAGVEQAGGEAFPNVLWVMTSDKRRDLIEAHVSRLPPPSRALFTITTSGNEIIHLKGGNT